MSYWLNQEKFQYLALGFVLLAGIIGLLRITSLGIGTSPDSVAYIGAAQNLLDGNGLSLPYGELGNPPLTHHAPLYPFILALGGAIGFNILEAARWINILLFAANIVLLYVVLRSVIRVLWLPLAGCLLMATSPTMILIHAMALTEALFIFLTIAGLYELSRYLDNPRRVHLLLSGSLLGLAFLIRYAGVVLVAGGIVAIFLFSHKPIRKKLFDSTYLAILGFFPTILWMVRNFFVADSTNSREFLFHPLGKSQLVQMTDTFTTWALIPIHIPVVARGLLLVGLLFSVIWIIYGDVRIFVAKRKNQNLEDGMGNIPPMVNIFLLFIIFYLFFLIVSISFIDANTPLNERILSPVFIWGLVLILYAYSRVIESQKTQKAIKMALTALASVVVLTYAFNAVTFIQKQYLSGLGFNSVYWRESEILRIVQELPDNMPIYTNVPEVFYLYTKHPALRLPKPNLLVTQRVNTDYQADLFLIGEQLRLRTGMVVYFHHSDTSSQPEEDNLIDTLGLCLFEGTKEGNIYFPGTLGLPCQLPQEGSS